VWVVIHKHEAPLGVDYFKSKLCWAGLAEIVRVARTCIDVGAIIVNDGPGFRVEPIPFGGVKASGIGHEGIRYAVEEFTHLKTLVL